jgi:predicted amidophosphoribosyltransferase
VGKSFSVKFESAKKIFEADTGLIPEWRKNNNEIWWCSVRPEHKPKVLDWIQQQGTRVYIKDCLSLSIALDLNLKSPTRHDYTPLGHLERQAKHSQDEAAINAIVEHMVDTINQMPYYKDADVMCAVPPHPDKKFDLPSCIAARVSKRVNKPDVTSSFLYNGKKSSITDTRVQDKWDKLEKAELYFNQNSVFNVYNKKVILIDDKYQSGITLQYVAMKLQQAGASAIYGLTVVKTLSDSDNS